MTTASKTKWGTARTVSEAVQRRWDNGTILRALHAQEDEQTGFPMRVRLPGPATADVATSYTEVVAWARDLANAAATGGWHLVTKRSRIPGVGTQDIPVAGVVDTPELGLTILGRSAVAAADRFATALEAATRLDAPGRQLTLARPHDVLAAGADWLLLLAVAEWVLAHPRPAVYPRQIPIPGVHTKLVETHRALLTRLLDAVLPEDAVDATTTSFPRRFGFAFEPRTIRLRGDNGALGIPDGVPHDSAGAAADVVWTAATVAALDPARVGVTELVVVENKVSFLSVPHVPGRLTMWGEGGGAGEMLSWLPWLDRVAVTYWGDIDTHGLVILDRVRAHAPHARSILMDVDTLLAYKQFWGTEPVQNISGAPHLLLHERTLYEELCSGAHGDKVRFEQEFVPYDRVQQVFRATANIGAALGRPDTIGHGEPARGCSE